jgi:FtsZ-binding cell division protein ZapB
MFSMRLLASSPEATLQIEPAVPGLVRQMASTCGLQQSGSRLDAAAWHIKSEDDAHELVDALLDPARAVPYIVCSVAERESQPGINSQMLAKVSLGIAKVVVIPAALTWVLTQHLGKALSVFNGAVRAYMPGFTYDANPFAHRLYFIDPKAGEERARSTMTALRWLAANESIRRLHLGTEVLAFSAVREASLDVERARLQRSGSADTEQLRAAQAQIDALKDDLRRSTETQQWLSDEHTAIEEHSQSLEQQLRGAQFRIQQLLGQIKARGDEPDAGIQLPETWDAFPDWCDEVLSGRVALSGRARRETKSADYEDPQTAARCLLWLANEYRDSRINGASGDLRRPVDEGIHNERCGADSFEFGWGSRRVTVEWHLKNGGNTREPRRCLRIYYFWDEDSQTVVIATMPAHIRTGAT